MEFYIFRYFFVFSFVKSPHRVFLMLKDSSKQFTFFFLTNNKFPVFQFYFLSASSDGFSFGGQMGNEFWIHTRGSLFSQMEIGLLRSIFSSGDKYLCLDLFSTQSI